MNQEQKSKFEAQTKLAIDNVHADIKSEFSSCTTLTELQDIYKGAMDATCLAIEALLKLYLSFDGEIDAFQEVGQKWLDDCADSINTMYADAAQRFVTVH